MKHLLLTIFCTVFAVITATAQDPIDITRTDFFVDLGYGISSSTNGYLLTDGINQCTA